ncbi:MAG: Bax inhibitor-1/YccA family protein [Steroidobacteraceae bacterium]|jgi:uncharacterized YccA/Bax inhibitor family protein
MAFQFRRSGNPGLNQNTFGRVPRVGFGDQPMTVAGTVNKSFLLLVVMMVCALWPWSQASAGNLQAASGLMTLGAIGGFILALIISFKPTTAPYLALPYAALEGVVLGGISAVFEQRYPGIAIQAIGATFAVTLVMLTLYRTRVIRVTERLRAVVMGAMFGIVLLYVGAWILSFFHFAVPFINGGGPLGIGFSILVVGVAAFMLLLDFDMIEQGAAQGAPQYMEWYGAFGLMVTLVWMYVEMLRLMAKLRE